MKKTLYAQMITFKEIIAPFKRVSNASSESGSGMPPVGLDPNISLINAIDREDSVRFDENLEQNTTQSQGESIAHSEGVS